jgi:hypothetical protein
MGFIHKQTKEKASVKVGMNVERVWVWVLVLDGQRGRRAVRSAIRERHHSLIADRQCLWTQF